MATNRTSKKLYSTVLVEDGKGKRRARSTLYLPKHGEPGPAALRSYRRFRVPSHQDTSATLQGAYPFLTEGGLGSQGVFVGQDLYSGGSFVYDPWVLYPLPNADAYFSSKKRANHGIEMPLGLILKLRRVKQLTSDPLSQREDCPGRHARVNVCRNLSLCSRPFYERRKQHPYLFVAVSDGLCDCWLSQDPLPKGVSLPLSCTPFPI